MPGLLFVGYSKKDHFEFCKDLQIANRCDQGSPPPLSLRISSSVTMLTFSSSHFNHSSTVKLCYNELRWRKEGDGRQ